MKFIRHISKRPLTRSVPRVVHANFSKKTFFKVHMATDNGTDNGCVPCPSISTTLNYLVMAIILSNFSLHIQYVPENGAIIII